MTDFLKHFRYTTEGYLAIYVSNFEHPTFTLNGDFEIPINTDVWFGPAIRKTKGHEKKDVLGTKVLWVDVDDVTGPFPGSTLPPSLVVRSGGGYHAYFILKEPCEDIETIERLNKVLALDIPHGDGSCWNANRIMRVPGTLNCKPEYGDPRRVVIEVDRPEIVYSISDIDVLTKVSDKIKHKIRTGDRRGHRTRSERDWKIIIDLIASGASDDLIRTIFAYQSCGDKAREEEKYFTHTLEKAREEHVPSKTDSTSKDAGPSILEGSDGLYWKGRSLQRISTFTLNPKLLLDGSKFETEDAIVCDVAAEGHVWEDIAFPKSAFNSVTKMDAATRIAAWQWLSNETTLRAVLPFLMVKLQDLGLPRVVGSPILGLHSINNEWYFLGDNHTMSSKDIWKGYEGPIAWLPSQRENPKLDLTWDESRIDYYKTLMQMVPKLNEPETIWPMIGWYIMTALKPAIEQCNYRFPILNVAGTRGSGKTTLILRVFMKMMGQLEPKSYDAGTTRFVTLSLLGSSNAIPVAFSEFRYDSVSTFIRYILLSYDTGHDPRGRADQSVVDYPLCAPFSIDGEDIVDDPAAQERMVVVVLHPKTIIQGESPYKTMNTFWETYQESPGPWILQLLLSKIPNLAKDLKQSFEEMLAAFPSTLPDRIRRNYVVVWTGIKYWCELSGLPVPDPAILKTGIHNVYNTETGRSKILADTLVEDIANAVAGGTEAFHFKVLNEGTHLWFQLASAHNYWVASRRRTSRAILERDAIRHQLQESPYFIDGQAMDGVWMLGIDLQQAFDLGLDLPSQINLGTQFHLGK